MLRASTRSLASVLVSVLLLAPSSLAFDAPLSSEAVRDAYFFGQRSDQKLTQFLNQYVHNLPLPEKGPYISQVQLLTPYAQVVDISRQNTMGYSAQQAAEDYRKRGDTIVVRVRIEFTPTYTSVVSVRNKSASGAEWQSCLRPQDFWRDFQIGLWQDDHWIDPRDAYGEPTYSQYGGPQAPSQWTGALVWLTFDANDVASHNADVKVFTPDAQQVVSTFDLASLR
jgi:hypothetical protein